MSSLQGTGFSRQSNDFELLGLLPYPRVDALDPKSLQAEALKGKIRQTVKVVGMIGQSDPAQDATPAYNEGSTTGVGYETIVTQKIKVMGGLCSRPGQEWKREHK